MIVHNIGQLATLAPLSSQKKRTHIQRQDLGLLENAWLEIKEGRVISVGTGAAPLNQEQSIDAQQQLVLPGLVDCHTHPVFGGNRSSEFCKRLDGASYQDIAAEGGGIVSSVAHTRSSSENELYTIAKKHLNRFLRNGVTTVEGKSGYGLTLEDELKQLRVLKRLETEGPQTIRKTCLALHAVPKELSKEDYIELATNEILPAVAKEDLADYVDAFVEKGYFEPEDCEKYFAKARELGLKARIHADEFVDSNAAGAAARWQALSADHLEEASDEGIRAMADKGVIAVILPGTSLYCNMPYTKAAKFREAGCAIALATDFNPGSCRVDNLSFIATLGALHCGMTVAETLAAVTYIPACALELESAKGHLSVGADADFVVAPYNNVDDWLADLGQGRPQQVWIKGNCVLSSEV